MSFCTDAQPVLYTIGKFMLVFKIIIPILLIIFGMVDLGKAVISSDEKAVSKAAKSLLNRAIAGVCIFFVPYIVGVVFKMIGEFKQYEEQYEVCSACISNPDSKKCHQ